MGLFSQDRWAHKPFLARLPGGILEAEKSKSAMITVNGSLGKSAEYKEEKMNARRTLCAICLLIVGLVLALEITALAGPPSVEYRPGVNLIYRGNGYNVAPQQNVPLYRGQGYQLPSFYRGWTGNRSARPAVKQAHPGLLSNLYVVPEVRVPRY